MNNLCLQDSKMNKFFKVKSTAEPIISQNDTLENENFQYCK